LSIDIPLRGGNPETFETDGIELVMHGILAQLEKLVHVYGTTGEGHAKIFVNCRRPGAPAASIPTDRAVDAIAVNRSDVVGKEDSIDPLFEVSEPGAGIGRIRILAVNDDCASVKLFYGYRCDRCRTSFRSGRGLSTGAGTLQAGSRGKALAYWVGLHAPRQSPITSGKFTATDGPMDGCCYRPASESA
jgi:hypothetical protein